MSQVMSDSRTSDLIMSLLHQNDIEAEVPEVKGIVMAERILVKGLEKLCKMIELGTTHEELVLQWQGINRFIDLYLKRKDELIFLIEATNVSNVCSNDLVLLKTIGFGDDNEEGKGIVHFNHDILIDMARELANKAKTTYGELTLNVDKVIRTGPSTNYNIEHNQNLTLGRTTRETEPHKISMDKQNLMEFEETVRKNLLKNRQDRINQTNKNETPLTSMGNHIPELQKKIETTNQRSDLPEDAVEPERLYQMKQEIIQLKQQLKQKEAVHSINMNPPTTSAYHTDSAELKAKKRFTANILTNIMKIKRAVDDVLELETYLDVNDGEKSMDLLISIERESKQLRANVDDLKQRALFEEISQSHENNLLELQSEYETLKESIKKCKDKCAAIPPSAANNFNLSKARLVEFKDLHLQKLASPSVYEFITEIKTTEEQNPIFKTKMAQFFVEVILKALTQHEFLILQDIKNNSKPKCAQDIISYLATHYGQPTYVENLAKQRHQEIGRLQLPFTSCNVAWSYKCLKAHLATIDSVKQMINYHDENYGEKETNIICSQGGLTVSYQQLLLQMTPDQGMSQLNLKLQTLTPRKRLSELESCYKQLLKEAHALYITSGLVNSDAVDINHILIAREDPQMNDIHDEFPEERDNEDATFDFVPPSSQPPAHSSTAVQYFHDQSDLLHD